MLKIIYDVCIVGAGPAGITAAIYSARKNLKTLVITGNIGGQTAWSGSVENYVGYQMIPGIELAMKFEEHLKSFDIELVEGASAESVEKKGETFVIKAKGKTYTAKTVVLATGKTPRMLNVPGENEFKNRGVTYCATCDGPLFGGMDVVVIGGGNSALDAAIQLIGIARRVYVVNRQDAFSGDAVMVEKVEKAKNAEVIANAETTEILGGKFVEELKLKVGGKERTLKVGGIFIEIGSLPAIVHSAVNRMRKN